VIRRAALPVAVALLLAAPAGAHAETTTIAMPGKFFDPPRATMVAGDTVLFRNSDFVTHDVVIGPFDSGPLTRFTSWSQQIDQPGGYPFICTLHAFMRGNLDVVAATLAAAPDGAVAGERLTLSGRTRAGTAHVGVEQSSSSGAWSGVGTGAAPAPDGTFTTTVPAVAGGSYRVTTPAGPSPAVTPRIRARVNVHLHVERKGRHAIAHVRTTPPVTGLTATLELYSRWHFRWRARRHAQLGGNGHAAFRLPAKPRRLARAVLRRTRRGPALVHSGVVKLPSGRPARDPGSLLPGGAGSDGSAGHDGHAR
jgi:plastocyanin